MSDTLHVYNRGQRTFQTGTTRKGDLVPGAQMEMPADVARKMVKDYPVDLMLMTAPTPAPAQSIPSAPQAKKTSAKAK